MMGALKAGPSIHPQIWLTNISIFIPQTEPLSVLETQHKQHAEQPVYPAPGILCIPILALREAIKWKNSLLRFFF